MIVDFVCICTHIFRMTYESDLTDKENKEVEDWLVKIAIRDETIQEEQHLRQQHLQLMHLQQLYYSQNQQYLQLEPDSSPELCYYKHMQQYSLYYNLKQQYLQQLWVYYNKKYPPVLAMISFLAVERRMIRFLSTSF